MSAKQLMFGSAACEKILSGVSQLADAIRVTLGPKSKSALIQKKWGAPLVCNDGAGVAQMIAGTGNYGFDAAIKSYVGPLEAGIVDSTKVVRIGLENAVSVASLLFLTEATMTELPEPPEPPKAPGGRRAGILIKELAAQRSMLWRP